MINRINTIDHTKAQGDGFEDLAAAVPAQAGRREAWVGLFVLMGLAAVLVVLFTLTDVSILRGRYTVSTVVQDAGGIRKGDPVQLRGVNIGRVRGFEIAPNGVEISLELDGSYEIPEDSRVLLHSSGLLGGTIAEVIPGNASESIEGGAVLPGIAGGGMLGTVETLGGKADTVLTRVQALLSEPNVNAIGSSAAELEVLLDELSTLAAEQRQELGELSASLQRSAAGVERATTGEELERVVARVDSITARLDDATVSLDRASESLASVLGRIDRGEGTLGRLTTDDSLYINVNQAAESLRLLLDDLRANPKRYLDVSVF